MNQIYIEYLTDGQPKFLCLTETWCRTNEVNVVNFPNYNLVSSYCRSEHKGGGVGIWSDQKLEVDDLKLDHYCSEKNIEVCGLAWKVSTRKQVYIITCYRSPSGDFNLFLKTLNNILDKLYKPHIPIIINGDFNINPDCTDDRYGILNTLLATYGLDQKVHSPTRVTSHSCTLIDHLFTNLNNTKNCVVLPNLISDHNTVLFTTGISNADNTGNTSFRKRFFSQENFNNFLSMLEKETWLEVYVSPDFNEKFDNFYNTLLYYFNICFPLKNCKQTSERKLWVTNELKTSSYNLKCLFSLKKSNPDLETLYKKAKKEHTLLVKSTKKNHYENILNNHNKNNQNKAAWKIVSALTNRKTEHKNITLTNDNKTITDPTSVAENFNNVFIETPLKIISSIDFSGEKITNHITFIENSFYIEEFSESEILNIINHKLKNKFSSGPDGLPSAVIKRCATHILKPLTYLVNLSLSTGSFPNKLKVSKVNPVYKKQDRTNAENYRPIAEASSLSKIFEYSMINRLWKFLNKYKILSTAQHGFRSSLSTMTAVDSFLRQVIASLDAGENPAGMFCDLSRAFDCVDHGGLLFKLERYGIRGVALNWFDSYLSNRSQFVEIKYKSHGVCENFRSGITSTGVGVPQGSILGPVLFLLFINDLPGFIKNYFIVMYADDASLFVTGNNNNEIEIKCNHLVNNLSQYFDQNGLFLNVEKTGYVHFHTNHNKNNMDLNIVKNNMSLKKMECVKFLGLTLDESLTWKPHCNDLISKLNTVCYQIRNLKSVVNGEMLISFYYAQAESRLSYGVCFWGSCALMPKIFKAQKRIIRCMAGVNKRRSCRDLFSQFRILTVYGLYIYNLLQYVFINKNSFNKNSHFHSYETRNRNDLTIPTHRLSCTNKSHLILGLSLFNKLPNNIKNISYLKHFNKEVKDLLLNLCIYNISEFTQNMT